MRKILCAAALLIATAATPLPANAAKSFTPTVRRLMTCNDGATGGALWVGEQEIAKTLELPWRNDEVGLSRVQAGTYEASIRSDGSKGWRIELKKVPNHSNVQLHIGNFPSDTEGCILVGIEVTETVDPGSGKKTCAMVGSGSALQRIRDAMQIASDDGVSSQDLAITVVIED